MKSRACGRNAGINEGSLQHQLTLLSFYQHLNILNPSRALTLLLTPMSTLLSLWFVACKPFDDVHSQEGVSNGQHQAASKGGTTPGHSCHMHLLLQCYNASCQLISRSGTWPAAASAFTCRLNSFARLVFPVNKSFRQHLNSLSAECHQEVET